MNDRCDFTDLLADQCAHCRKATGEPEHDPEITATWEARYPGRCDWCDGRIQPGERMGRDEHDSYVCERCLF